MNLGKKFVSSAKTWGKNTSEGLKTLGKGTSQVFKGDVQGGLSSYGKGIGQISEGTGTSGGISRGIGGGSGFRTEEEFRQAQAQNAQNAAPNPAYQMETPTLGAYKSALTGNPNNTLQVNPITGKLDISGVESLKERALNKGPSAWANMATDKQRLEQSGLVNSATNLASTEAAQNRAALASRGGLRGGAGLRLANQAGQQGALARQNVYQQGALQRADIGLQDQQMKNQFLTQLPGAQLAAAQYGTGVDQYNANQTNQANQFNIGNRLQDQQQQNAWDTLSYQEKMKLKGAGMTADAIARSGNTGKGWFGQSS